MADTVETTRRVVVKDRWEGNLLPTRMEELLREVILSPGSSVTGSVFGHIIRIEGPASIQKAVYARKEITIVPSGNIRFFSSVGAKDLVTVTKEGNGQIVVGGDVVARSVNLKDAVVLGNILADEVRLERTIVFGVVYSETTLELTESTALAIRGETVTFNDGCGLMLPFAAGKTINIKSPVDLVLVDGVENNLQIEDIGINEKSAKLHGGHRITDLTQVQTKLENSARFLQSLLLRDSIGEEIVSPMISLDDIPISLRNAYSRIFAAST